MRSKDLFMLIDQIDRRFVEEAWEGDLESGKTVEIVLERSPFYAIKFAAAVAACIMLFGAGFFTIANIRTNDPFAQPSSSGAAESPGSPSESDSSSESGEISESSDVSTVTSFDKPEEEFNKQGIYKLENLYIGYGDIVQTKVVEKIDNYDYAVIYVDETNATEEHPLAVSIFRVDEDGKICDLISEKKYITGRGKYGFYYNTLRGAGSPCILCLENDFKETNDEWYDIRLIGSWSP